VEFWAHANHLSAFQCKLIMELALFRPLSYVLWSACEQKNEIRANSGQLHWRECTNLCQFIGPYQKHRLRLCTRKSHTDERFLLLTIHKNAVLFSLCALHIKREERKIGTMYCDTLALNKQKEESRKAGFFYLSKHFK
jgi:hypothetical protein